MATAYINKRCWHCDGHGVTASYSHGDFEGPTECRICGGSGGVVVYPSGRCAMWPGGPLVGSWPEAAAAFGMSDVDAAF